LLATATQAPEISEIALFDEPLIAALPVGHRLATNKSVTADALGGELMVLAEGHCLANQALAACGEKGISPRTGLKAKMQAATLETLVNLVAAGYGATLIPALAADSLKLRGIVLVPLAPGLSRTSRTISLASRPGFPRPQALRALERIIREAVGHIIPAKEMGHGCAKPAQNSLENPNLAPADEDFPRRGIPASLIHTKTPPTH
jgi:LysR family hydrogen peroxide-inducible transcriptional activator